MRRASLAFTLASAGLAACQPSDSPVGPDSERPVERPALQLDYVPAAPDHWTGCGSSGAPQAICDALCGERLGICSGQASEVCPTAALQQGILRSQCEALCDQYPTFIERACAATTCDGFLATLVDLAPPEVRARCGAAEQDADTVSACSRLYACAERCAADRSADASACQARCIDGLGARAIEAVPLVTAFRQCMAACRAQGLPADRCRHVDCGCWNDRCFGTGVPCERVRLECPALQSTAAVDGGVSDGPPAERPADDGARGCCEPEAAGGAWQGCNAPGADTSASSCGEIVLCRASCGADPACERRCITQASEAAYALFRYAESICEGGEGVAELSPPDDDRFCHRDGVCAPDAQGVGPVDCEPGCGACCRARRACRYDGLEADAFGAGRCASLMDCVGDCRARQGSPYCERACQVRATCRANLSFDEMQACLDREACTLSAACDACADEIRGCREP